MPSTNKDKFLLAFAVISVIAGLLLVVSITASLLAVGYTWWMVLLCVSSLSEILLVLFSIVYFIVRYKSGKAKAIFPFVINIASLILTISIYQVFPKLELGFRWRLGGYTKVVELVENGQIKPDENGLATLPQKYQYLSDTGQIRIYDQDGVLRIVFFDSVGILGENTAYVYRSNGIPPDLYDIGCDGAWPVKTSTKNWFYCDSQ